jgi:hypothetical protein
LPKIRSFELQNDKAPAHAALSVREFLANKFIALLPQAPYFPDLSPFHLYLFPKLNRVHGYHFQTLDNVQKAVTDVIKTLREVNFQSCYEAWKIRWAKRVASEGYYFEGDSIDLDE